MNTSNLPAYAHTAEDENGSRLPEQSGKWQLLAGHLRNVAARAAGFAKPLELEAEAELAGTLHDLGKYSLRFQQRLRNPAIHGINHWAAGATKAAELGAHAAAFAVDGHHTGMPARDGDGLRQTIKRMRMDEEHWPALISWDHAMKEFDAMRAQQCPELDSPEARLLDKNPEPFRLE